MSLAVRPALMAAALALGACARPCLFDETGRVCVEAAPDANRPSATAVDVLAAQDGALADRLAGLIAGAWFAQREQLRRDYPATLGVAGWEIAPGQSIGSEAVRFRCGPAGIFVFASLRAPGAHRVRLRDLDRMPVRTEAEELVVSP